MAKATNAVSSIQTAILADRVRVSAILEHPDAVGREALAKELALRSSLDAEQALALLRASPKAETSAAASFLRALGAEAIDLSSTGAAKVLDDPKAARLAEIKRNVGKRAAKAGA